MSDERMAGPQVVPRDSERAELMREFFATDPGWHKTSWDQSGPIPGEQVLPGTHLCILGKPDGWAEYQYLLAGMAVVRGMVAEQRGLGYRRAKELVNDLLDARTASDEYAADDRLLSAGERSAEVPPRAVELRKNVNGRLHALFDEVVGHLALADRRARHALPDRQACENLVDELVRVARIPEDELPQLGGDTELDFVRAALLESLVQTPDWQGRAEVAESQLEQAEYAYAALAGQVRELLGAPLHARPSPADLRNKYEDLEGRALAAEEKCTQMAAHTVQMVDFLGRYRTNDMSSDMEMVHNALMSSPSSSDTEKVARALLDGEVERRFKTRTTEFAEREAALRAECAALHTGYSLNISLLEENSRRLSEVSELCYRNQNRFYAALGLAVVAVCGLLLGR